MSFGSSHLETEFAGDSGSEFDVVHPAYLVPPDHPIRGSSRTDAGLVIDRELVRLAGMDARCRIVQAELSRRLIAARAWRLIGFVRLSDYARERLGCSPRLLEEDAHVLKALDRLSLLRAALDRGELSWTKARLLARVANANNEIFLLRRALQLTTRELEVLVRGIANTNDETQAPDPQHGDEAAATPGDDESSSAGGASFPQSSEDAVSRSDSSLDAQSSSLAAIAPSDETVEPAVRWKTMVSPRGRREWLAACEIASRTAGSPLSPAQVLELVVAEVSGGQPSKTGGPSFCTPTMDEYEAQLRAHVAGREKRSQRFLEGFLAETGVIEGFRWLDPAVLEPGPAERLETLLDSVDTIPAHEIDRRLREVRRAAQRIDFQLATLLRLSVDCRLYQEVGFATIKLYAESRLGISSRRIWQLLEVERRSWRHCTALRDTWRDGRISHLAACTLLPVIDEIHGDAWIRRAGEVTLRELADQVAWALDCGERESLSSRPAPPPPGTKIPVGGVPSVDLHEVQMRAHADHPLDCWSCPGGVPLDLFLPLSVVALLEVQLDRYRHGYEERWRTFERLVCLAILEWTSAQRHRDPVFQRDGWRCSCPGCSSRRELHDHHLVFRSLGGDHAQENRTTVCAAHHLHGIHEGIVTAEGKAPDDIVWALGCAPGREPVMRLHGDRYISRGE